MKKKKLKLSLNKSKITNLQANEVKGGSYYCTVSIWACTQETCVSDHGECTDAPTMTCADWSCKCLIEEG